MAKKLTKTQRAVLELMTQPGAYLVLNTFAGVVWMFDGNGKSTRGRKTTVRNLESEGLLVQVEALHRSVFSIKLVITQAGRDALESGKS